MGVVVLLEGVPGVVLSLGLALVVSLEWAPGVVVSVGPDGEVFPLEKVAEGVLLLDWLLAVVCGVGVDDISWIVVIVVWLAWVVSKVVLSLWLSVVVGPL